MNMYDLLLFLMIILIAILFWRFRAMAEVASVYLSQYCERQDLQLISVARHKTKIGSYKGKLDLQSHFRFEFSGDGENTYLGSLSMSGLNIIEVVTPAYKVH